MIYKGVNILECKHIRSYIDTYLLLDKDNWEQYLDKDRGFQRALRLHKMKLKARVIAFNLVPYIIFYIVAKGIG